MKSQFAFAVMLLSCAVYADEPVRVTSKLHDDGTRTDTRTDPEARTQEEITYDGANRPLKRVLFQLDAKNLPVNGFTYDAKGTLVFKSVYRRDTQGRIVEQFDYSATDVLMRKLVLEYGLGDRLTKVRAFDPSGKEIASSSEKRRK